MAKPAQALHRWHEQIAAYRMGRRESEEESWQREAASYQDWVRQNDYMELVLPHLFPVVDPASRVLEVGPGTGAFTLPLARAVHELVAIEPSAPMRTALAHNLAQAGIANVHIVPETIESALDGLAGPFDLALASYSLYNVEEIDTVLRGLTSLARNVAVLVGSGERREWYRELYGRFKGSEFVSPPQLQYLYPLLLEMGIYADVHVFWTSYHEAFDTEAALVDHWMADLHLPEGEREALRAALLPQTECRHGQIGIFDRSRAALVWIERGRNV